MRRATRIVATSFGAMAGIAGLEHGVFEMLQGNARPENLMIASMGPPCIPEEAWHACEPALTILPSYLIAGILTVILSLLLVIWSAAFVQRRAGGAVMMLLAGMLLLFGGGIFPPVIALVGGATGTRITRPLAAKPGGPIMHFAARLWPWPLIVFVVWGLAQFAVGYLFNDLLQRFMGFSLLLIFTTLPLSVYTGYAYDVQRQVDAS